MHFQRVGLGPRSLAQCTIIVTLVCFAVFATSWCLCVAVSCLHPSLFFEVFSIFASFLASYILEVMEVFQISPEPDSWAIPPLVEYLDAPQTWALWQHCRQYNCSLWDVRYRHVQSAWHGL